MEIFWRPKRRPS